VERALEAARPGEVALAAAGASTVAPT